MMKQILVIVAVAVAAMVAPVQVEAAPLQPACKVEAFRQHDMTGTYVSQYMQLDVFPCGGSSIVWTNAYGQHGSVYYSAERLPGGGIIAIGVIPDPVSGGYLDSCLTIIVKPAEVGYVEVATFTANDDIQAIYRLRKVS
jgi:hypothetical protein